MLGGAVAWCLAAGLAGAEGTSGQASAEEFEAKLGYQTGTISLSGGIAKIRVPEAFRFIGPEGSRRLLTEAWGNPPGAARDVLGMLIPTRVSPLSQDGWGIVISYDQEGYVNDSDAAKIDYAKMLKEMQEATREANAERAKQGFDSVELVGWAETPSYEAATHKLYWAKELAFGKSPEHTLNYSIRVLGRRGVLVLNAVAGMSQLQSIRSEARSVLSAVEFNEGHRYADYLPGKDKAAAYGIGGLILGATAAKAGLFKALWVGILAFKKAIILGILAIVGAIKRFFGGGGGAPTGSSTTTDDGAAAG
jgi:uncharacterized membrane-anchored protein